MSISALEGIHISDDDIDQIEILLGNVSFDAPRRDIIKKLDSFDVQAFPGSGKTTVLIAKLAILAKKWPYEHKGICVLSHTNVAREEIETRLGQTDLGKKLLSYPHFVGTVHSFFDTYISIPWLRSNANPITLIDRDIVLEKRWKKLSYGTRDFLTRRNKTETACEAVSHPVSVDIGCGETTASYQNVKSVVEQSQKDGFFTFNEMLYIAKHAISECPSASIATQTRFPILFIDEAQDTSGLQWELINSLFNDSKVSARQAYGDANQAIFQSYSSKEHVSVFPSEENLMTIPNSHRFGYDIAKIADSLAISQKGLVGSSEAYIKNEKQHTVFLFDKTKPETLLCAYAKHILSCFTDEELSENSKLGCYVVGMVHNKDAEPTDSVHFPVGLKDYYSQYSPGASKANIQFTHMIDYFRAGASTLESTYDYAHFLELVSCAFRRIINDNSTSIVSTTSKAFAGLLSVVSPEQQQKFRKAMLYVIKLPFSCVEEWCEVIRICKIILKKFFGIIAYSPLSLEWTDPTDIGGERVTRNNVNPKNVFVFTDVDSKRTVSIRMASIHSVKGRTHLATMVVETYWYDFNIKSLFPWLCGKPKKQIGDRNANRMKCHYVALTRAKGLICLAAPKDSVTDEEQTLLRENGWKIVVV